MPAGRFPRDIASLEAIDAYVTGFVESQGLDPALAFDINLVVEELFTNMVKYSQESHEAIAVELSVDGDILKIELKDFDVDLWDPTRAAPVDVNRPVEERRGGGHGIHFVRQIADTFTYAWENRNSTTTVTKRLAR